MLYPFTTFICINKTMLIGYVQNTQHHSLSIQFHIHYSHINRPLITPDNYIHNARSQFACLSFNVVFSDKGAVSSSIDGISTSHSPNLKPSQRTIRLNVSKASNPNPTQPTTKNLHAATSQARCLLPQLHSYNLPIRFVIISST